MKTKKISVCCVIASAFLLAGNFSPTSSNPLAGHLQQSQAVEEDKGLFVISKKWIFPIDLDNPVMSADAEALLARYGQ